MNTPLALLASLSLPLPLRSQDEPEPPSIMSAAEADPSVPRGVIVNEPGTLDGPTLFAPLNSNTIYLMDLDGEVLHTWVADSAPGGGIYLLEDGSLLRCGREDEDPRFRGGGIGGRIQRLAPDGSVAWHYQLACEHAQQHHDLEPLPNGNVLAICWERIPAEEAIARGRDPEHVDAERGLWPDRVVEIRPTPPEGGEIVWFWRAWDHLVQDVDPELPGFGAVAAHAGRIDVNFDHRDARPLTAEELEEERALKAQMEALGYVDGEDEAADEDEDDRNGHADDERRDVPGDWLHTNAVDHHPELDLIVLSSPHLSEIWVLDHSTTTAEAASDTGGRFGRGGEILWRWGNPKNYGAGEESDRRLFYQHDPQWLSGPDGSLRLTVFNNGRGRGEQDFSSVDELVLPFDAEHGFARRPDAAWGPEAPVWSYSDPEGFFSAFISGAQRLANGNTLICSGTAGRLFEVTREGRIVWDFRNGFGGDVEPPEHAGRAPTHALFRGTRLARGHAGVRALLAADH